MGEWGTEALTDVLDFREGPGILAKDFHDEGVPLVRLAGVKQGAHILDGCNYLDPLKVAEKWSHFRLTHGDVLLSTSASLGEVAVVGADGVGAVPYTGLIRFRPVDDRMAPRFVSLALTSGYFKAQIEAMGVGSVMKHFGPMHLRQMRVEVPPRGVQEAIADVATALDDRIAANTRLAATADELSCAEFTRAVSAVAPGPLTFADVASIGGGGTPQSTVPEFWDGDVRWLTPTDVTALPAPYISETKRRITEAGLEKISSSLYPVGSIFMTSRATIGAFALAERAMAVNQGFIVVEPNDTDHRYWLFHEMRSRVSEFLDHANGATFMELSRGNFKKLPVRMADDAVVREFNAHAKVLHDRASAAIRENARLIGVRNMLLPQLMSGTLRVREAAEMAGL